MGFESWLSENALNFFSISNIKKQYGSKKGKFSTMNFNTFSFVISADFWRISSILVVQQADELRSCKRHVDELRHTMQIMPMCLGYFNM